MPSSFFLLQAKVTILCGEAVVKIQVSLVVLRMMFVYLDVRVCLVRGNVNERRWVYERRWVDEEDPQEHSSPSNCEHSFHCLWGKLLAHF